MAFVSAPGKIEIQEKRLASLSPKDVLSDVKACSICGSDLHIFGGRHPSAPLPMAIGHELSGQVLRHRSGGFQGQRRGSRGCGPVITCGGCYFCQKGEYHLCSQISFQYRKGQGGFAPYFVAEEDWVHPLPQGVSYEEGALIEPLSVALHAAQEGHFSSRAIPSPSSGPAPWVYSSSSSQDSLESWRSLSRDVHEFRLEKGRGTWGPQRLFITGKTDAVEKILGWTSQLGVDRAFEVVGLESTLVQSLQVLKKGGSAVVRGHIRRTPGEDPGQPLHPEGDLPARIPGILPGFQTAIKLVDKGLVNLKAADHPCATPLRHSRRASSCCRNPDGEAVKVVITME